MEHRKKNIKIFRKESSENDDSTTILIKLTGRVLSQLQEMQSRLVVQEELLLNLRKQANTQKTSRQFEPIRGIHGLAAFLGVSPVTAQKLKNSGKIPYAQYERLVLFDPKKVMDALESINKTRK